MENAKITISELTDRIIDFCKTNVTAKDDKLTVPSKNAFMQQWFLENQEANSIAEPKNINLYQLKTLNSKHIFAFLNNFYDNEEKSFYGLV